MKTLTKEKEEEISEKEFNAMQLGLISYVRKIETEEYILDKTKYIKFNIPDSIENFKSGNGEGVWGVPITDEDQEIYNSNSTGEVFEVILLNEPFLSFVFPWGSVIMVETRGEKRPVVHYEWLNDVIVETMKLAHLDLADILEIKKFKNDVELKEK